MRRFSDVTRAVAWRSIHHFLTQPAFLVPALLFPLFFFTAFSGALSGIEAIPGFDFPSGYTAFQFAFVMVQASAFGGVFAGFSIAADFESGFTRRLMLASPNRRGILAGYAVAALFRAVVVWVMLMVVALLAGMQIDGGAVDLVGLYTLAALVNVTALMFSAGVAMRLRTMQAGPAMQIPVFLLLFLAPVYVPLELLEGWIHTAAQINPITPLLELSRDLISGQPANLWAYAVVLAMFAVLVLWALTGLRRAERAGG
jgi:ABC-2 type transport system permease protein